MLLALALSDVQYAAGSVPVHPAAITVLLWAIISFGLMLVSQVMRARQLQLQFGLDILAAAIAVWVAPSTLVHALALLACSCQLLFRSGFSSYYVAGLLVPLIMAPVSVEFSKQSFSAFPGTAGTGVIAEIVFVLNILNAGASLAISATRADQLRQFADQAVSIKMLKLDRSLEFDLQRLVDLCASLFTPQRAYCLIGEAAQNSVPRRYECGKTLTLTEHEMRKLISLGENSGSPELLIDNNLRAIFHPATGERSELNEQQQAAANLLAREGIMIALLKWVRIGRGRGVMICVFAATDTIKRYEARLITEALDTLFPLLDSISEAERQFIADAHDVARRDLHDGVLQTLAAVRMRLLTISRRDDMKQHVAKVEVQKIADILTLEQARLRGLLETSEDEDHGINLVTRLDVCLRSISMQWEIDARLEFEEPAIPIDKESAINIEHLVREAVANAVRHAKSNQLTVRLSLHQYALQIAIIDRSAPAAGEKSKKGGSSMPLKSASLLHRLRLVNGSAYAEGLDKSAILAVSIPMQRVDNA